MRVLRALAGSGRGRLLLGLLALYLGWQGWLLLAAPAKVDEALRHGRPRVNVEVTLAFPPERFHVLALQRHGRVSGAEGNAVELRSVPREALDAVARPHWVRAVGPMREE